MPEYTEDDARRGGTTTEETFVSEMETPASALCTERKLKRRRTRRREKKRDLC